MPQRIVIDPVTRIEGHAKITIHLDDTGAVSEARFHVTEFRGFEQFCVGRPLWEMAGITSRICGICPVSHLLASAKAGDAILAVTIPPAAEKLRRMMNLAQIIQSHALSFFHLSAPDLLLGMESDPAARNLFGLLAADPELARGGIRLRQFGQEVIEHLGGRKIHPAWAVPGGVRAPLAETGRAAIRERVPEARALALDALGRFGRMLEQHREEAAVFGNFPTLFLGLVGPDGAWEHYDGMLRFVDSTGAIVADGIAPSHYREWIGEAVEPWSYLKFPFFRPHGYPAGTYRVGPLARLNICSQIGTPLADAELRTFRDHANGAVTSSFFYHHAPDRNSGGDRTDRTAARRPGHRQHPAAGRGRGKPARRHWRERGAARHAVPPLPGGRRRPHHGGEPADRHRPEQPGDEPRCGTDRAPLCSRRSDH
jgi:NAD-reducing hydrogenase large subunit